MLDRVGEGKNSIHAVTFFSWERKNSAHVVSQHVAITIVTTI